MRLEVIIVQVGYKWETLIMYTFPCLASVKHIVNKMQRSLQLTTWGTCVVAVPRIACVQSHLAADALNIGGFILYSVQVGASQPVLIPPALCAADEG